MNCESFREMFVEYQMGELAPSQVDEIDRHLATGCPVCRTQMADILDGIELLLRSAPSSQVSEPLREHIIGRATKCSLPAAEAEQSRSTSLSFRNGFATVFACVGSLAAGLILMMNIAPRPSQPVDPVALESPSAPEYPPQPANANADSIGVVPPSILHARHASNGTQFVSLRQTTLPGDFRATVIWDPVGRELHFYGYQFPYADDDHRYVLWIEGPSSIPLKSKSLEIDYQGNCFVSAQVMFDSPPRIFVTLEDSGFTPEQPSDQLQLLRAKKR